MDQLSLDAATDAKMANVRFSTQNTTLDVALITPSKSSKFSGVPKRLKSRLLEESHEVDRQLVKLMLDQCDIIDDALYDIVNYGGTTVPADDDDWQLEHGWSLQLITNNSKKFSYRAVVYSQSVSKSLLVWFELYCWVRKYDFTQSNDAARVWIKVPVS